MVRVRRLAVVVLAGLLMASACTMKNTEQPPLSGPSELALSLSLYANPDAIAQDGSSQSTIVIQARDQGGQPIKSLPLRFDLVVNNSVTAPGKLSAQSVNTDTDGRATVIYTAPPAPVANVDVGTVVTVRVTPTGTDYRNAVARSVDIRLVPSGTPGSGPVASFTFAPANPIANSTVTFNGTASRSDTGVSITSFTWNFGDGTFGTGPSPLHVYRETGSYTVTLFVTDAGGRQSNPVSQVVSVVDATSLVADFVFSPTEVTTTTVVYFSGAMSKPGAGRTIVDYTWNFGDGKTGRGITVSKGGDPVLNPFYPAVGIYTVTLTVRDDVGQTATIAKTLAVK